MDSGADVYSVQFECAETVDVSFNQLESLSGIEQLGGIRQLRAYNNKLRAISGIERQGTLYEFAITPCHYTCSVQVKNA